MISSLDVGPGRQDGATAHLALRGTLDTATADRVRTCVEHAVRAGARHVVFDLGGLRFIDSSGLGALLAAERLLPDGASLVGSRGVVRRVLQVAALEPPLHRGDEGGRPIAAAVVDGDRP